MLDTERVDELLKAISDKYTAVEIVEILGLTEWDILEMFREQVLEKEEEFEL
jgi:DNA-binding transcriptional ArsR family regulator